MILRLMYVRFIGVFMTGYWLCVTNERNWNVVKRKKVWGVPARNERLIKKVKKGDFLVFYVSPKRIGGIFRVVSEPFFDDSVLFSSEGFFEDERFPHRVKIEPVIVPKTFVKFDPLIPRLNFIVNKERWTGYLRRAMLNIPERDYKTIYDAVQQA